METTIFKTYLPVFTGFYNTIFEADNEDMEIDDINSKRKAKGLPPISYDDCKFDYEENRNEIAKAATDFIEGRLKELGIIKQLKYEKVNSPRFYNFTNDEIHTEAHLTKTNLLNIKKFINVHREQLEQFLIRKFTKHDGFKSFYSNNINDWSIDTKGFTEFSDKIIGYFLEFICEVSDITEDDIYSHCQTKGITNVYATNYNELTGE